MNDREVLQDLVAHPGWAYFVAHVEREWGAGGRRFERTLEQIADMRDEDVTVLRQMQQIAVTRREILRLLTWPAEETARLREPEPETSARRPLAPELVGQGRRGSL